MEYVTIITPLLATADGMVFLTVLARDQVYMVHSIGRFRCGIGKLTPSNNFIFGILGEKVGYQIPPIAIVTTAGLVPWFQLEEMCQPLAVDIAILETAQEITVTEPLVTGYADDRPKFSFQKLLMIPKAWPPYFMVPQSPWGALLTFKKFLGAIPEDLKEYVDFIKVCISVS